MAMYCVEGGLTANPAGRTGIKVAAEPFQIYLKRGAQFGEDDLCPISLQKTHLQDVRFSSNDALGEEETGHEIEIMPGGSHRDRQGLLYPLPGRAEAKTYFERLLDSQPIRALLPAMLRIAQYRKIPFGISEVLHSISGTRPGRSLFCFRRLLQPDLLFLRALDVSVAMGKDRAEIAGDQHQDKNCHSDKIPPDIELPGTRRPPAEAP